MSTTAAFLVTLDEAKRVKTRLRSWSAFTTTHFVDYQPTVDNIGIMHLSFEHKPNKDLVLSRFIHLIYPISLNSPYDISKKDYADYSRRLMAIAYPPEKEVLL